MYIAFSYLLAVRTKAAASAWSQAEDSSIEDFPFPLSSISFPPSCTFLGEKILDIMEKSNVPERSTQIVEDFQGNDFSHDPESGMADIQRIEKVYTYEPKNIFSTRLRLNTSCNPESLTSGLFQHSGSSTSYVRPSAPTSDSRRR